MLPAQITIQWLPRHRDIPGNDLADGVAKEAPESGGVNHAPTCYHSVKARIKAKRKDLPPQHQRTRDVYTKYSEKEELKVKNRKGQSLLVKIRSGHSVLFLAYRNWIDET